MLFLELSDFAAEHVGGGSFVYLISPDIDDAFDTGSHHILIKSLAESGADGVSGALYCDMVEGEILQSSCAVSGGTSFQRVPSYYKVGAPGGGVVTPVVALAL